MVGVPVLLLVMTSFRRRLRARVLAIAMVQGELSREHGARIPMTGRFGRDRPLHRCGELGTAKLSGENFDPFDGCSERNDVITATVTASNPTSTGTVFPGHRPPSVPDTKPVSLSRTMPGTPPQTLRRIADRVDARLVDLLAVERDRWAARPGTGPPDR